MADVTDITSIPLYQILGAPLLAMVQAETQAAKATAVFIEKVGFYTADDLVGVGSTEHNIGDIRTIAFRYTKTGVGGEELEFNVEIPVLAIVPIPAIQISEAEVDFSVEINDAVEIDTEVSVSAPRLKGQDNSIESSMVMFKAGMAKEDSRRAMKVNMKIKQADTPAGMQALFRMLEQGISSISSQAGDEEGTGTDTGRRPRQRR